MEQPQPEVRRLRGEEESRVSEKEDKEVVAKVLVEKVHRQKVEEVKYKRLRSSWN